MCKMEIIKKFKFKTINSLLFLRFQRKKRYQCLKCQIIIIIIILHIVFKLIVRKYKIHICFPLKKTTSLMYNFISLKIWSWLFANSFVNIILLKKWNRFNQGKTNKQKKKKHNIWLFFQMLNFKSKTTVKFSTKM